MIQSTAGHQPRIKTDLIFCSFNSAEKEAHASYWYSGIPSEFIWLIKIPSQFSRPFATQVAGYVTQTSGQFIEMKKLGGRRYVKV